jgi:geranylgeranyl reductase family protein
MWDVAIVGSGPAGATCAAFCAAAGLRTLVIERAKFPREKVCGDCLNPSCWPVLERLGVAGAVRAAPHGKLRAVEFIGVNGRSIIAPLPAAENGEIAIRRSIFDEILLRAARALGVEVREGETLLSLKQNNDWELATDHSAVAARVLVAADGRNSTVAQLQGLSPRRMPERVALQTHVPMPPEFGDRVVMQLLAEGYSGQAPVGDGLLNLCLVSRPNDLPEIKRWAENRFGLEANHPWRTVTPLRRAALPPIARGLFLIGDAARVVEPFTGEGIYYALRSGELAAAAIARGTVKARATFRREHAAMYRGRLWVNRLARAAVVRPRFGSALLEIARLEPNLLRLLTAKIVR